MAPSRAVLGALLLLLLCQSQARRGVPQGFRNQGTRESTRSAQGTASTGDDDSNNAIDCSNCDTDDEDSSGPMWGEIKSAAPVANAGTIEDNMIGGEIRKSSDLTDVASKQDAMLYGEIKMASETSTAAERADTQQWGEIRASESRAAVQGEAKELMGEIKASEDIRLARDAQPSEQWGEIKTSDTLQRDAEAREASTFGEIKASQELRRKQDAEATSQWGEIRAPSSEDVGLTSKEDRTYWGEIKSKLPRHTKRIRVLPRMKTRLPRCPGC